MAGGIDWFRWHHGSITDPKFQLIAKKAGVRFGDVIAVWAFILEQASADADRGVVAPIDYETLDFLLGADGGTAAKIVEAMTARGLLAGGRVAAWERRQPKREDENAAARKAAQRKRDEESALRDMANVPTSPTESRRVTTSHDREEESREEKRETPPTPHVGGRVRSPSAADPDGFAEWYEAYRRKDARADAVKAWRQLSPDAELQARMLAALRVWPWNEARHLNPLPATWLRGRRWEDEAVSRSVTAFKAPPQWCLEAGFENAFEAQNAGCYARNAHEFRDGKRIKEAA